MARGIASNPQPCRICGGPGGRDLYCNRHRPSVRQKYFWTPEKDELIRQVYRGPLDRRHLSAALKRAAATLGYPRHIVRARAMRLGLTHDTRHRWTEKEIRFLRDHAGERNVKALARSLGHGWIKVQAMMGRMDISARVRDGYTQQDIAKVLGVDEYTVRKWERWGWLTRSEPLSGRFRECEIENFVRRHPEEYDLRKVDQAWFKGLLFPLASCFRPQPARAECAADRQEAFA